MTLNSATQPCIPINTCYAATMWGNSSASALAGRFARLIEQLGGDTVAAKAMGQQRDLLAAVARAEPATLGEVATAV